MFLNYVLFFKTLRNIFFFIRHRLANVRDRTLPKIKRGLSLGSTEKIYSGECLVELNAYAFDLYLESIT